MEKLTRKQLTLATRIYVLAQAAHSQTHSDDKEESRLGRLANSWAAKRLRYMGIEPGDVKGVGECLAKSAEIMQAKQTAAKFRVG